VARKDIFRQNVREEGKEKEKEKERVEEKEREDEEKVTEQQLGRREIHRKKTQRRVVPEVLRPWVHSTRGAKGTMRHVTLAV
jgi:hypothetical protein